jgi:hypothetical protein
MRLSFLGIRGLGRFGCVAVLNKGHRLVKGLSSGFEGGLTVDLILTVRAKILANESRAPPAPTVRRRSQAPAFIIRRRSRLS